MGVILFIFYRGTVFGKCDDLLLEHARRFHQFRRLEPGHLAQLGGLQHYPQILEPSHVDLLFELVLE